MDIFFHKNLKHLRKVRGFTQQEVASVLEVTPSGYGRLEREQGYPKMEGLIKLTDLFDVNLHDLVFRDIERDGASTDQEDQKDEVIAQTVLRLNLEIDRMAREIIERADPNDLEELSRFRAELIKRNPERARAMGINPDDQ